MTRPRVVVAGLGDTGLLTAIHLARHVDVVGISAKPGLVSGQELGLRLTRPAEWARDHWIPFDRYRKLDGVRTVHGSLTRADLDARVVGIRTPDGHESAEPYDVLVISTGVRNGFWRNPLVQTVEQVNAGLRHFHDRIARAGSIAVVGGGPAAVSAAFNIATTWPDKQIGLYFPGTRALAHHHPRVWDSLASRLHALGVAVHPGHRAEVPSAFSADEITAEPVRWRTGQPETGADAVIWTIGRVRPNTEWLPEELLDESGYVRVDEFLRVGNRDDVYAIGDVAATDPLRNSARGRADRLLANNIRAGLTGGTLTAFRPAARRWGSVVGVQRNVLEVFAPNGRTFRLRPWSLLQPLVVDRAIYGGIRSR